MKLKKKLPTKPFILMAYAGSITIIFLTIASLVFLISLFLTKSDKYDFFIYTIIVFVLSALLSRVAIDYFRSGYQQFLNTKKRQFIILVYFTFIPHFIFVAIILRLNGAPLYGVYVLYVIALFFIFTGMAIYFLIRPNSFFNRLESKEDKENK
jgi:hypothetical protein